MTESEPCADFPAVHTSLCMSWISPCCGSIQHVDYDNFKVYEGLVECCKCEKPYRLTEPWSSFSERNRPEQPGGDCEGEG